MQKANKNNKRKEKIGQILSSAPERAAASEEINNLLDRLFAGKENDPDYQDLFRDIFEADMSEKHKPSKKCLQMLAEAKRKLGIDDAPVRAPKLPLYRRTYFHIASVAAAVLIAAGVALTAINKTDAASDPEAMMLIVEAIPEIQKDVLLPDSTFVWVNESSKLSYPETFGSERRVTLEGEAYFNVESDKTRPFCVQTEHLQVRVLGTEFDVKAYPDMNKTEVMLFEGAVEVSAADRSQTLAPGEKLTYDHITQTMSVENIERETIGNWRANTIFASNKSIPELLDMIANYYDIEIKYDPGSFAGSRTCSVGFDKNQQPEKVLTVLSEIGGNFDYAKGGDNIIYIRKR